MLHSMGVNALPLVICLGGPVQENIDVMFVHAGRMNECSRGDGSSHPTIIGRWRNTCDNKN